MEPSELDLFDLLLQVSEESGELIQASSKLIRKERGNNPTPASRDECFQNVVEEMADISVVLDVLLDHWDVPREDFELIKKLKKARWRDRLNT